MHKSISNSVGQSVGETGLKPMQKQGGVVGQETAVFDEIKYPTPPSGSSWLYFCISKYLCLTFICRIAL